MELPVSAYRRRAGLWASPCIPTTSGSRCCCCGGQSLCTLHESPMPDAERKACAEAGAVPLNHRQALKFDADGNHLAAIGEKLEPGHDNEHLCKPTAVAPFLFSSPGSRMRTRHLNTATIRYQVSPSWYRVWSAFWTHLNTAVDLTSVRV